MVTHHPTGLQHRRELAVKLHDQGHSVRQIATALGVGVATVHRDLAPTRTVPPAFQPAPEHPTDRPDLRTCPGPHVAILRRPCPTGATIPASARVCAACAEAEAAAGLDDETLTWTAMAGLNRIAQ